MKTLPCIFAATLLLTGCNSKMDARVTLLEYKLDELSKQNGELQKQTAHLIASNKLAVKIELQEAQTDRELLDKHMRDQLSGFDGRLIDLHFRLRAVETNNTASKP